MRHLFAATAVMAVAPLQVHAMAPAAEAWSQLAKADVEAALRLIEDNHPGANQLKTWVAALPR